MAFTAAQRAKAAATRAANKKKREQNLLAPTSFTEMVAITPSAALKKANDRIAELEAKLASANDQRSDGEKAALAQAEAQGLLMQAGEEVPSGRTRKVKQFKEWKSVGFKDNGDEILKPLFRPVAVPTYFYRINMAPCGGDKLRINGEEFYHGATYEFDIDTLRTVKDIVSRTWAHDRDIHGSDENFYRAKHKDIDPRNRISARGM